MSTSQEKKENAPILKGNTKEVITWTVRIPRCCIEGWDTCPHVVQRKRAKKGNVGM